MICSTVIRASRVSGKSVDTKICDETAQLAYCYLPANSKLTAKGPPAKVGEKKEAWYAHRSIHKIIFLINTVVPWVGLGLDMLLHDSWGCWRML